MRHEDVAHENQYTFEHNDIKRVDKHADVPHGDLTINEHSNSHGNSPHGDSHGDSGD